MYIKASKQNIIISVCGCEMSQELITAESWFEIENPGIEEYFTTEGVSLYKWDGQQVVKRTEAEIEADRAAIPAPPPSETERLRADTDFLLAMGGYV